MYLIRVLVAVALAGLGWGPLFAQVDLPPALLNRPPVAAPTSAIQVAPIEVVRSMSEVITDFGGGLLQGLMASHGLRSAVLVAAQDDRVIVTSDFGCCAAESFSASVDSHLFASIAVMQLAERQRLSLSDSAPQAGGVTIEQVLAHQADPALLRTIVENSSGQSVRDYVSQNIVAPLSGGQTASFAQVIGGLLVALLNDGTSKDQQILRPETAQQMIQSRFLLHAALPGWTYGLAEMERNGWRALQWDGLWSSAPDTEARLVVVPDANLAYFVIVDGRPVSSFWRALDDGLFDRILPRREPLAAARPPGSAPSAQDARAVAGLYEASDAPIASAAPLKAKGQVLDVRATAEGGLTISGREQTVLAPQAGGYWANESGNLRAAASEEGLLLSTGLYRPLRLWKRPALYGSLALVFAVGVVGAYVGERRARAAATTARRARVALACGVGAFLIAALFAWHALPAF